METEASTDMFIKLQDLTHLRFVCTSALPLSPHFSFNRFHAVSRFNQRAETPKMTNVKADGGHFRRQSSAKQPIACSLKNCLETVSGKQASHVLFANAPVKHVAGVPCEDSKGQGSREAIFARSCLFQAHHSLACVPRMPAPRPRPR